VTPLRVGDVVTVGRACMGNAAQARAVVVEVYQLDSHTGWQLLFENGATDGFSPGDCEAFAVTKLGHASALAHYEFISVVMLLRDFQRGKFAAVWQVPAAARAEA
jgi:hypothetical protein